MTRQSGQRDCTFGVYDMAQGALGVPRFVEKAASLSLLRPSNKVAAPIALPNSLGGTLPVLHLLSTSSNIAPEFHLPDIPGLPPMPAVSIQKSGNLWMVDPAAQPALKQILGMSMFAQDPSPAAQDPSGISGSLSFNVSIMFGDGSSKIDAFIAAGYAAMASIQSLSSGTIRLLFTKRPEVVATQTGGDSPMFVLLSDHPVNVVNAANGLVAGTAPTPSQQPPGGGVTPAPSTPGTTPSVPGATSATPTWIMPLAVGAVLLGGAALLLSASKK